MILSFEVMQYSFLYMNQDAKVLSVCVWRTQLLTVGFLRDKALGTVAGLGSLSYKCCHVLLGLLLFELICCDFMYDTYYCIINLHE